MEVNRYSWLTTFLKISSFVLNEWKKFDNYDNISMLILFVPRSAVNRKSDKTSQNDILGMLYNFI